MEYTQDIMKQIEDVVEKQAAQMVGTDTDKETLEQAKELARAAIMEEIEEAVARQMKERADQMKERAAAVEDYNAFCQKEMDEPDFKETQTFAVNTFFYRLKPTKRAAVSEAYQRIENNTATVADIQIVMEFFTDAKNARRAAV